MSESNPGVSRADLDRAQRIVIKVGSSLLTSLETGLEREKIQSYCAEIARLMRLGKEIILVSSGSIAEGCMRLGWSSRPVEVHRLQAAAAVGQIGLMRLAIDDQDSVKARDAARAALAIKPDSVLAASHLLRLEARRVSLIKFYSCPLGKY